MKGKNRKGRQGQRVWAFVLAFLLLAVTIGNDRISVTAADYMQSEDAGVEENSVSDSGEPSSEKEDADEQSGGEEENTESAKENDTGNESAPASGTENGTESEPETETETESEAETEAGEVKEEVWKVTFVTDGQVKLISAENEELVGEVKVVKGEEISFRAETEEDGPVVVLVDEEVLEEEDGWYRFVPQSDVTVEAGIVSISLYAYSDPGTYATSYNLYCYTLVPGMTLESSGSPDAVWNGMGVCKISGVSSASSYSLGTLITTGTITYPDSFPDITVDGTTYKYAAAGSENADKQGYYTVEWIRTVVSDGANAGKNNFNTTVSTGTRTFHRDGQIFLNEKDKYTVAFYIQGPGESGFTIQDDYSVRVESGYAESKLLKPGTARKTVDGIVYKFDGWYKDEACTQAANFDGTITANTRYYGKYVIDPQTDPNAVLNAAGGTWTYDGNSHAATASVTGAAGYTIYYKVGENDWTTTAPSVTNGSDGTVTVSVKAEKLGYVTLTKTVTLKIEPRPVTITVDDKEKYYGTADPAFTGSITSGALVAAGDLGTISYSRTNTAEDVGTYAQVLDASYQSNSDYTVTVNKGTFTIRTASIQGLPSPQKEEPGPMTEQPTE